MQSFQSSALGAPHEYRSWVSDQVMLVVTARNPIGKGGKVACRDAGSAAPYSDIYHTQAQLQAVLLDLDKAEMAAR